uniref:Uncharacterized protein n=1 Tax=Glossina austeni TaxID=7395 RepID=A0A1A9VYQ5_GLOAU
MQMFGLRVGILEAKKLRATEFVVSTELCEAERITDPTAGIGFVIGFSSICSFVLRLTRLAKISRDLADKKLCLVVSGSLLPGTETEPCEVTSFKPSKPNKSANAANSIRLMPSGGCEAPE